MTDEWIGFTSHDQDLVIDGVLYHAKTAIDPTALRKQIGLNPDNFEVELFLDSELIRDVDVRAGRYDGAEVVKAIVDYANLPVTLEDGLAVTKGNIGEIKVSGDTFFFGVDTKDARLSNNALQKFTNVCRYTKRLEDSRCPVNIDAKKITGTITNVVSSKEFDFNQTIGDTVIFSGVSGGGYLVVESGSNFGIKFWIDYTWNNGRIGLQIAAPYTWEVGDEVTIYPGCNGLASMCKDHYNALDDWGGCPTDGNFAPALSDLRN